MKKLICLVRYYSIQTNDPNIVKFYYELVAGIYNNFITIAFSHCPQEKCEKAEDKHHSSLIIFNYPNSTDKEYDLIEELNKTNKKIENDFCFNLNGTMEIQNNIFGYVYKGVYISKIPENLVLKKNGNIIENNSTLLKDECLTLSFSSHEVYSAMNYSIEFSYILTEPEYNDLNKNTIKVDSLQGINSRDYSSLIYEKNDYIGKVSNFIIYIKNDLKTSCVDNLCNLCYSDNTRCITCKYNYSINENQEKECLPYELPPTTILIPETSLPISSTIFIPETSLPISSTTFIHDNFSPTTLIKETTIEKTTGNYKNSIDDIIQGNYKGKLTNEQIEDIYNELKKSIKANTSKLIETENVIIQISSLEEQKNNNNPNISSIDLGDCEDIIKGKEDLSDEDSLIIIKTDLKSEDLSSTYIQYEVYNPKTLKKISLDICEGISISINIPVNLEQNTESLYSYLNESGYNLFNLNDSFYNDICSTFTTENGTDLTLADRKNIIYDSNANISMCQESCQFLYYNTTLKKAKCDCSVQIENTTTDINKINFKKDNFADSFYSTLTNSNFLVLKCFKLVFSVKGQKNNKGSYAMTAITFLYIILMFIFIFNGHKKINSYIKLLLKQKLINSGNLKNNNLKINSKVIFPKRLNKNRSSSKKRSLSLRKKIKKKSTNIGKKVHNELKRINYPPKKSSKKKRNSKKLQNSFENFSKSDRNLEIKPNSFTNNVNIIFKNQNILLTKKNERDNSIKKNKKDKNTKKASSNQFIKLSKEFNIKSLNDEEMNDLDYEVAIEIDKRTYFQYYFSLLKKKHLILFAFIPNNDYNVYVVKISLLLLSFSLYFTINGFFFSDSTMNKINEDKGVFNIIFQIPQILYSTIISSIINMLLKRLSLSEKQFLSIKQEKDFQIAEKKSKDIKNCLIIKFTIYCILSFLLMIFFWYFISCFCAVYKNTQMILIKDTLLSFALSMVYPFGLNLLPGMFRIPALRAHKKDKKCLYKFSSLIALI